MKALRLIRQEPGRPPETEVIGEMSPWQAQVCSAAVGKIAGMIPVPGSREAGGDYEEEITFGPGGAVSMRIVPFTERGRWWTKYVSAQSKSGGSERMELSESPEKKQEQQEKKEQQEQQEQQGG